MEVEKLMMLRTDTNCLHSGDLNIGKFGYQMAPASWTKSLVFRPFFLGGGGIMSFEYATKNPKVRPVFEGKVQY